MSLECGECEHDLRGGHHISCSRYNLQNGVAFAMLKATGTVVDEETVPSEQLLKAAQAAIDKVREYDEARKPEP